MLVGANKSCAILGNPLYKAKKVRVYKLQERLFDYGLMSIYFVGNNPMVGATVACAVLVEEALKA